MWNHKRAMRERNGGWENGKIISRRSRLISRVKGRKTEKKKDDKRQKETQGDVGRGQGRRVRRKHNGENKNTINGGNGEREGVGVA